MAPVVLQLLFVLILLLFFLFLIYNFLARILSFHSPALLYLKDAPAPVNHCVPFPSSPTDIKHPPRSFHEPQQLSLHLFTSKTLASLPIASARSTSSIYHRALRSRLSLASKMRSSILLVAFSALAAAQSSVAVVRIFF